MSLFLDIFWIVFLFDIFGVFSGYLLEHIWIILEYVLGSFYTASGASAGGRRARFLSKKITIFRRKVTQTSLGHFSIEVSRFWVFFENRPQRRF